MAPKLLSMLANDADCVSNLSELNFSMTEITAADARHVSKFTNLKSLYCYDTRGADYIVENARLLPIERLGFEMAQLSTESLRMLSEFPNLTQVHFEQVMLPNEIAILDTLPPRITVRTPFPAENEPEFKERSDQPTAPESR
ncbi:hypothetical protein SH528x_002645 [Novipirellula sp. SH528]|uniref:hypothetical protein n=1 Tax=Novipirellula sp. SH528 TaxID=3454466 RepID=UPI003F9F6251